MRALPINDTAVFVSSGRAPIAVHCATALSALPDDFEKKLAKEQAVAFKDRIENSPPIGAGPDGKVRTYKRVEDIPVHKLEIVKP
jgi:hypothetical protein